MKRVVTIVCGLSLALVALTMLWGTSPPGRSVEMPEEIAQFYEDSNFAACFSTPFERAGLHLVADLDRAVGIPERLRTVGSRLKRIGGKIQRIDPGIFTDPAGFTVVPGAEVTQVTDVQMEYGTARVRVKVWPMSPAHNVHLVANYERQKRTRATEGDLKDLFDQTPRTEVHSWQLVNGTWMRKEAILVLL